jgi:hypothetical protein
VVLDQVGRPDPGHGVALGFGRGRNTDVALLRGEDVLPQ